MASLDTLPPDQRAVLDLVLQRGRSYDDIARLLAIDRAAVRARALAAFDAIGPDTGLAPESRALITDYLLGQLPAGWPSRRATGSPSRRTSGRGRGCSPRSWARSQASRCPRSPTGTARSSAAPATDGGEPAEAPSEDAGPNPGDRAADPLAGSRGRPTGRARGCGGAIFLVVGAMVVIVVVVVLLVVLSSGSSSNHSLSTAAQNGTTPSGQEHVYRAATGTTTGAPTGTAPGRQRERRPARPRRTRRRSSPKST